jgi:GNAT superfamily N-acetyltransferase
MIKLEIHVYADTYKHEVIDLILNIQQREFNIPISIEAQPDLNEISNFYQIRNGNFWVAVIDSCVIGTIGLLDIGNSKGALRKMFVAQQYRGKRYTVGQALLNTLFDWAGKNNFTEIFLGTTEKFIAAQKFYIKNGFKEIQKKSLPVAFPVMSVDTRFYGVALKPANKNAG